ncbi:MAG: TonB-dependent receptor, partial [Betaproteobacteria bacterium]|nr:TonB-dependent receptor [Betaproteobacteria bacterium]
MKKSALRPLVVSLFPLLTLTAAEAQNAGRPIQLPDVAVTATRILQPVDAVPIQTIIISRQDIDEAGSTTLVELLQRRAGLEIRPLGGVGQPSGVFIRGANSQHT